MAIEITTQNASAPIPLPRYVDAALQLSVPTDITLSDGNAGIRGYQKHGANLVLQLADGQALTAENFFVIGENGDFSRLIAPDGETLATGLMVPEPDQDFAPAEDLAASEGFATASASSATVPGGEAANVDASAASGSGWARPAMFAGAGLTTSAALLGVGVGSSGNDTSSATTAASASDAGTATDATPHSDTPLAEGDAPLTETDAEVETLAALLGDEDSPFDMGALESGADPDRDAATPEAVPEEIAVRGAAEAPDDPLADHPLPEDSMETLLTGHSAPSDTTTAPLTASDLAETDLPQDDLFESPPSGDADDAILGGLFSDATETHSPIAMLTDLLSELIPEADL